MKFCIIKSNTALLLMHARTWCADMMLVAIIPVEICNSFSKVRPRLEVIWRRHYDYDHIWDRIFTDVWVGYK